jgi:threonine dehydratase
MSNRYIEKILKARVYDVANETPLDLANDLTQRFNNQIYLKREDLQPVFSFKLRGAYNKIVQLSDEKKQCGVIAASAGNHAQGVALSAKKLGIKSLIVMPKTTPAIKVKNVKSFGAKIVLHGDNYDEACEHALKLAKEKAMSFVHPYDDPDVIAGQGTIAMEILRQFHNDIHAIFVPVGGGGLISGIASYVKYVRPEIKIIGVEPEDAPSMYKAIESNKRVTLKQVGIFADGVAVKQVGKETFKIAKELVDEILLVNTDEICAAIKDIFDNTRSITEPAGALSVAGLKKYIQREKIENKVLVAIESGANINFDRLRHVAERAEVGEQREALLAVSIPEEPGSFLKFCKTLGKRSITEFNYRFNSKQEAHVFVGVELNSGEAERASIIQHLEEQDYGVINMTDNELAKIHIRYMVGGHAVSVENEVLYRFVFPERPGALLNFLSKLGKRWNISLFHYRNQGAAYGRVLVGAQVPLDEKNEFCQFMKSLDYPFWDETKNPAYKIFAGSD